jgi:hypothetical protein
MIIKCLKDLAPNVGADITAPGNKLSDHDLNAIISHAHMKVDSLRRQLTEQQVIIIHIH